MRDLRTPCMDADPEVFFPPHHSDGEDAKRICRRCDFQTECLRFALDTGTEYGVFGGLTESERASLVAKREGRHWKPPTDSDRCGSYSGSSRHTKRGEMQCDPCRVAKNEYEAASRRRRALASEVAS